MNALELNPLKRDEQSSQRSQLNDERSQVLNGKYCAINQCTCGFASQKNQRSRFL